MKGTGSSSVKLEGAIEDSTGKYFLIMVFIFLILYSFRLTLLGLMLYLPIIQMGIMKS